MLDARVTTDLSRLARQIARKIISHDRWTWRMGGLSSRGFRFQLTDNFSATTGRSPAPRRAAPGSAQ
jgi:hypothetical protein